MIKAIPKSLLIYIFADLAAAFIAWTLFFILENLFWNINMSIVFGLQSIVGIMSTGSFQFLHSGFCSMQFSTAMAMYTECRDLMS